MEPFFILSVINIIGLIVVFIIQKNANKFPAMAGITITPTIKSAAPTLTPAVSKPKMEKGKSVVGGLLARLNLGAKKEDQKEEARPTLTGRMPSQVPASAPTPIAFGVEPSAVTGTAAIKITPPEPSTALDDPLTQREKELSNQMQDLRGRYSELESDLDKKSELLQPPKELLEKEAAMKEAIEKEKQAVKAQLDEAKKKTIQVEDLLSSTQSESDDYKKRVEDLQAKASAFEKQATAKDDEIDELLKKLKTKEQLASQDENKPKDETKG